MVANIVIIEPDATVQKWLEKTLIGGGYKVTILERALDFIEQMHNIKTDLILSTYDLPNITAETFYKDVCEDFPEMAFIFISAPKDVDTVTNLLKNKNVDYMVKPLSDVELLARIKTALAPATDCLEEDKITIQDLCLDLKVYQARRNGEDIILSPTEFKLLHYLMANAGRVLSRDMILTKVWGSASDVSDRIVDVYVGYLREKIDDKHEKKLIETVPGFGYKISE